MIFYDEETIQLIDYGIQDCSDLHSWGPGMRSCYIIHYIISGEGYVECQGHRFHLSAGQSFLLLPYVLFHYYPDKDNPWVYTWVNFIGKEAGRYLQDICMDIDHPVSPPLSSFPSLNALESWIFITRINPRQTESCWLFLVFMEMQALPLFLLSKKKWTPGQLPPFC